MTAAVVDLDLFAGPGGWDQGVRALSLAPRGIEWDTLACSTAQAAGHHRHQADVASIHPPDVRLWWGRVRGLIASPPCQGFSPAGKGDGRKDAVLLLEALEHVTSVHDLERVMDELRPLMTDPRTLLVLEPLRWALYLHPAWLAWEQVVPVLVLWESCARILRANGYSTATGVLNAEQHGVPQTRRRAILVARSESATAEHGPAQLPTPTHSRYHVRTPERLDPGVLPWVSMAQALEWGATARPGMTVTGGGAATGGAEPFGNAARQGLERERVAGRWAQRSNYSTGSSGGGTAAERGRSMRDDEQRSLAVTSKGFQWQERRPATTVCGDSGRVMPPGHKVNADDVRRLGEEEAARRYGVRNTATGVRVTVQEAAVLQSFPPDYPWQGKKTAQYRQVGDAVPPLLARAIVAAVMTP